MLIRAMLVVLVLFSFAIFHSAAIAAPFSLSSSQIYEGGTLPQSMICQGFGCTGGNQSPKLSWIGEPDDTKSYAITMFDPDAPTGVGWWHWLVFNIPASIHTLPQAVGSSTANPLPSGSREGYTDFGSNGYGGLCPPVGDSPHRCVITIHALDVESLPTGAKTTGAKLAYSIQGHILAKAKLTGRYGR